MKRYNKKVYKKRNNKRRLYFVILFSLILSIGLGYAYLQSVLTFSGTTKISKNNWDIHFENLKGSDDTSVTLNGTTGVRANITLSPGESYTYTVKAVNNGSIDAKIGSITPISIPAAYQNIIEYSLNYQYPGESETISVNDVLRSGTSETIKFKVKYKDEDDLTDDVSEVTLNLNFSVNYIQADENITEVVHDYSCPENKNKSFSTNVVCKRAEKLHTETCSRTDSNGCIAKGYTNGDTITYGNCGEDKLVSGDAFDCDLNGNGVVDVDTNGNSTERFYYVSDLYTGTVNGTDQFDSNYAVLIYHKNIGTEAVSYYYENRKSENWHGPVTLLPSLPTRSTWANENIGLKSTSRTIVNEQGAATTNNGSNTIENPFVYTDRVGRLLTVQEINKSCNITVGSYTTGELDSCEYLMEDSDYSKTSGCSGGACYYWLETPRASDSNNAWVVYGVIRFVVDIRVSSTFGVRPVIEIKKTDISLD